MTLRVGDTTLDVAQVTPDRIFLREPIDLPPQDAELVISIDGHETCTRIRLPDGASADCQTVSATSV